MRQRLISTLLRHLPGAWVDPKHNELIPLYRLRYKMAMEEQKFDTALIFLNKIVELDPMMAVQRELLLVKVRADTTVRSQVLETVTLFRAKVVDVSPEAVTIEATGTADKIEALLRMLEPYGIREMAQSGMVAMARGPRAITAGPLR